MKKNLKQESASWKAICPKCKKSISENDDYHTLHEDSCGYEVNGLCFCDLVFHAECCPECNDDTKKRELLIVIIAFVVLLIDIIALVLMIHYATLNVLSMIGVILVAILCLYLPNKLRSLL